MTQLSVNVNKAAVLRNSRGGDRPSVTHVASTAIAAGCHGITVHPRPDLRHIRPDDCYALSELLRAHPTLEFNIEGNPFAPANARYPGLLALVADTRPHQVTLVPDGDAQLTSDHGFDVLRDQAMLAPVVATFKALGTRVSVFVDSDCSEQALACCKAIGIDRVEIYTGPFAHLHASGDARAELQRIQTLTARADELGIGVNAGHDLSQSNLADLLVAAPSIAEVSIGHALFDEALYQGLQTTISAYLRILTKAF
jgi:pyridoxine 5-phosphate synthase